MQNNLNTKDDVHTGLVEAGVERLHWIHLYNIDSTN